MSKGSVGIAALKLIDPNTRRIVSRDRWLYAVELSKLLLDLHYEVAWFQIGDGWRSQVIPDVPLYGVLRDGAQLFTYPKTSDDFYEKTHGYEWAIYFDLILAYPQVHEYSIAISPGITWDDPLFEPLLPTETEREEWKRRLFMALRAPQKVVTAESGMIHWATATWAGLHNTFEYIPDFVPSWVEEEALLSDYLEFDEPDEGSIKILFPGALTPEAGISATIRAMEVLLDTDQRLEFYIIGNGSEAGEKYLREWSGKHNGTHFHNGLISGKTMSRMDIILFPGKSCQESGMSCLAAMFLGKAVVVGQNSGLTDRVIHDHNGIVINPNDKELVEVVQRLANLPEERRRLGENAHKVAQNYVLPVWRQRWQRLIERTFR